MSEEEQSTEQAASDQQADAPVFEISKLYIKDASFESPNAPTIFTDGTWQPEVNVQINGANSPVGQDLYEVVLTVTVTVKQNDKVAFLIEVHQAGVFAVKGYPEESLRGILGAYCLETLFPYAREEVSNLVSKGGFPQLMLSPVNFNAIYEQQQAQNNAAAGQEAASH